MDKLEKQILLSRAKAFKRRERLLPLRLKKFENWSEEKFAEWYMGRARWKAMQDKRRNVVLQKRMCSYCGQVDTLTLSHVVDVCRSCLQRIAEYQKNVRVFKKSFNILNRCQLCGRLSFWTFKINPVLCLRCSRRLRKYA